MNKELQQEINNIAAECKSDLQKQYFIVMHKGYLPKWILKFPRRKNLNFNLDYLIEQILKTVNA